MIQDFMFNSESVTEGHPDKLCDQISDAIVDHFLAQDPRARIRAECAISGSIVFIAARFGSSANIDFSRIARKIITRVGYDRPDFNPQTCSILTSPQVLSIDSARQFDENNMTDAEIEKIAVKNQVTLFGFACDHTPQRMPLPISLAHRLTRRLNDLRRQRVLPYLMPDGKVQVGVEFRKRKPKRIHSVTVTAEQRDKDKPSQKSLRRDIIEALIEPVFQNEEIGLDGKTRITVNPEGAFIGGPTHHSGLTGRKNAVDTYGEYARLSEKALSGKDPMRIDRVGAYAARYVAKNIVAAGLADECEVMLSYSIGLTRPVSMQISTFNNGKIPEEEIAARIERHFDFRLVGILRRFQLRFQPALHPDGFYQRLAAHGHCGRADLDLPWEKTDLAEALRE
jgi:S-adenosylmethionine synthetase